MVVQNNISAMNSHRLLTQNNNALSGNLEKLSSGYAINRAADDAAGLAISEKMRAQLQGLEAAEKNANDGISLVQTAEGALAEVHSMLSRMAYLATQSANGTYSDEERVKLQSEVSALNEEIDRISQSTQFNGIDLLQNGQRPDVSDAITDNMPTQNDTNGVQTISTVIGSGGGAVCIEVGTSIGKGVVEFVSAAGSTQVTASVSTSGNVQIMVGDAFTGNLTEDDLTLAVKTAASAAGLSELYSDYTITLTDPYDKDETATDTATGQKFATALKALPDKAIKLSGVYDSSASPAGDTSLSVTLGKSNTYAKVAVSGGVEGASIQFEIGPVNMGGGTGVTGILISSDQSGNITVRFDSTSNSWEQKDIDAAILMAQSNASTTEQKEALAGLDIQILSGSSIKATQLEITGTSAGDSVEYVNADKVYFEDTPAGASTVEVAGVKDVVDDYMLNVSGGLQSSSITINYSDDFVGATTAVKISVSDSGDVTVSFNNNHITNEKKITQKNIDEALQEALRKLVDDGDGVEENANKIKAIQDLQINIQGGQIDFDKAPNAATAEITSGSKLQNVDDLSSGYKPGDIVLQVGETRDDYQQVTVEVFNMDANSLKLNDVDISYLQGAQAAIEKINNAIDSVSAVRASFGAVQNRLDHTINNLGVASENLQAAESRIRDTDMAAEMMEYTKNNILIQSSQAMLSQANQVPQGVLQLLQ